MTKDTHHRTTKKAAGVAAAALTPSVAEAWQEVRTSFEQFCLSAGIETLQAMLEQDAAALCGVPYERHDGRRGHRWGTTRGRVAFHGGKVMCGGRGFVTRIARRSPCQPGARRCTTTCSASGP